MIDTIKLFIPKSDTNSFDFSRLQKTFTVIPHTTNEHLICGDFNNFKVRQRVKGTIILGSLPKYLLGENLTILSLAQIEDSLNEIAKGLNFDLSKALVKRVDIAYNFELDHKVKNYLNEFGDLGKLNKDSFNNLETLTYHTKNKSKEVTFYHKIPEMRAKGVPIPKEYKGLENKILRYELRLHKKIEEELGQSKVFANMLYNKDFFSILLKTWRDYYFSIHKVNKPRLRRYVFENTTLLKTALASLGIKQIGYDNIMDMIDGEKEKYDKTKISRLKKLINEVSTNSDVTVTYQLISELDKKVDEVYNTYLANQ